MREVRAGGGGSEGRENGVAPAAPTPAHLTRPRHRRDHSAARGDGSMKNDMELRRDIQDELKWDPRVRDAEIGVAAKDGVVTLSGHVETYAQKYAAERAAERVSGVRAIAEELEIKLPSVHMRTDTEIAHKVADALKWDIEVPDEAVKAKVENGWVTLEGQTDWQYQKTAAERAVRYLTGVKGVANLIHIRSRVSAYDVSQHIKDALRRTAEADADKIQVEAHEGKVTLRGTVRSYAEMRDAERAAWSASGVTDVEDKMTIAV
jgi:osmotically-inducible protein OsmY